MSKKSLFLLTVIFSFFLAPACQYMGKKACCGKTQSWFKKSKSCCGNKQTVTGQANMADVNGQNIKGEVFFEQVARYTIKVTANFTGLKPNQKFGFHVHEFGNCENKALAAGGHFNPWNKKHGGPQNKERHLGDLGNVNSDAKGQAAYSAVVKGKVRKFLGRSAIIHALPDDLKSQPTGNSGDRIACGVIVAAMPVTPKTPPSDNKEEGKKASENIKAPSQTATKTENQKTEQKVSNPVSSENPQPVTQKVVNPVQKNPKQPAKAVETKTEK